MRSIEPLDELAEYVRGLPGCIDIEVLREYNMRSRLWPSRRGGRNCVIAIFNRWHNETEAQRDARRTLNEHTIRTRKQALRNERGRMTPEQRRLVWGHDRVT